ncbi:hypothetical protein BDN70DRAFT_938566 [Pholiota conissans]|uniref:Uncharacterized protein n=1 Tax=Pholiota conissans TaxID=109636 RepID=A0A9P6CTT4_9AGAR|nr:hypothetical protein BDN70DRAFT_938566 [Pholiota conissans]
MTRGVVTRRPGCARETSASTHGAYQFDDERIAITTWTVGVLHLLIYRTSVASVVVFVIGTAYSTQWEIQYAPALNAFLAEFRSRRLSRRAHRVLGTYSGVLTHLPIPFPSMHVVVATILVTDTPTPSSQQSARVLYIGVGIVVDTDESFPRRFGCST